MRVYVEKEMPADPLSVMQDGDLAVVVDWQGVASSEIPGTVVQRYADDLVLLGQRSGACYPDIFRSSTGVCTTVRVRVLKPGETVICK